MQVLLYTQYYQLIFRPAKLLYNIKGGHAALIIDALGGVVNYAPHENSIK